MVMVTIALVMAVIVTNIYAKKESPERPPDWCIVIVSRFYPAYCPSNIDNTGSQLEIGKPEVVIESGNEIMQHSDDAKGDKNKYDVTADFKRLRDKRDRDRPELEWKLVAKFTDRVFFWLFLVLSIIVHTVLLLQFRPKSPTG